MARRRKTNRRSLIHTDTYWQQIVENRIPLVGAWFREIAAVRLAESTRNGSRQAAQSLARALDCDPTERVREIARQALLEVGPGGVWNAVWEVWLECRSTALGKLLFERNLSATHPPEARVYSHLLLGKDDLFIKAGPEVVPALVEATSGSDQKLATRARDALANMSQPESRAAFYEIWMHQREPWQDEIVANASDVPQSLALRAYVLLHRGQIGALIDESPEVVGHLIRAYRGPDKRIAGFASDTLHLLQREDTLDELCRLWIEDRHPLLEEIIIQKGIIAGRPPENRLRTALLIGRIDLARKSPPQHVNALLEAAADSDERIASRASEALASLIHPETRAAVCDQVIDQDDPIAKQAALQGSYLPETTDRRALYLLLTAQWDAYAALDFDQRIVRTVFSAAPPALRQRIAAAVQSAGRIDFLRILTGGRGQGHSLDWNDEEIRLLVGMLIRERQWERLWKLVFDLPLFWSIEVIRTLNQSGWKPDPADTAIFHRLTELAISLPEIAQPSPLFHLPVAVQAETLRVSGRVNDIAFSPTAPLLAIGTGHRQVVLWNYQKGAIETVLRDFEHSISRVVFNATGMLLAAERSSPDGPCRIVLWDGDATVHLGRHDRSITDLCPLDEDRLLSVGNDRQIVLWDLNHRSRSAAATMPRNAPRARRLLLSPDRQHVFYIHERISFFSLPELNRYQEFYAGRAADRAIKRSTGRCAVFLPPEGDLAVGQHNGQVVWYQSLPHRTNRVKHLLTSHTRQVQEIRWLPRRTMLLSAGGEGEVQFIRWPDGESNETLIASDNWLTTMETSADESFMATGSSDSTITLWDLRTNELSALIKKPLGVAQPADLALLNAIISAESGLSPDTIRTLEFMQLILQYRLRFDIVVADLPRIQPGSFDIQLDEVAPKNE